MYPSRSYSEHWPHPPHHLRGCRTHRPHHYPQLVMSKTPPGRFGWFYLFCENGRVAFPQPIFFRWYPLEVETMKRKQKQTKTEAVGKKAPPTAHDRVVLVYASKEKGVLVPFDLEPPERMLHSARCALQFRKAGTNSITPEVKAEEGPEALPSTTPFFNQHLRWQHNQRNSASFTRGLLRTGGLPYCCQEDRHFSALANSRSTTNGKSRPTIGGKVQVGNRSGFPRKSLRKFSGKNSGDFRRHSDKDIEIEQNFPVIDHFDLQNLFRGFGSVHLLYLSSDYYPNLVQEFYANMTHKTNKDLQTTVSTVKGVRIILDRERLETILAIQESGNLVTVDSNRKIIDKDPD
ncbi:hypothetical protein M9H77_29502 [Catharanthus roseus]|uniref:Uncharacterized protein n=1 Tax=Catharanthus roseus TaxID=4058 RepID=A0ACB9ZUL4_CATRO|nr:hypothetical protein M9H77_29502 [Catharanthus roseus]